ncbi:MAG: hypothetical protein K5989_12235 [Lachnospiraceae bacterium]|nr:hypothetical protein [Lachnospiraceae bacterium]
MDFSFAGIIPILVWIFIIAIIIKSGRKVNKNKPGMNTPKRNVPPRSRNGEYNTPRLPEQYNPKRKIHNHPGLDEGGLVVHEEAEEGYVILNGVKRRLKDCKNL